MIPIVPALIPNTKEEIVNVLPQLNFSPEIHIDMVDGQFVPYTSWPYNSTDKPVAVKSSTDGFTLEVDLMVADPIQAAEDWLAAGADMLVFHVETISLEDFAYWSSKENISVGISALNDTPLAILEPYLSSADYVQLMGIAKIGAQGQSFDRRVLERLAAVKQLAPGLPISIDGSVNQETIGELARAGADRFICGSAIVKAANPYEAHSALSALIN